MKVVYLDLPSVEAIPDSFLKSTEEMLAHAGGNLGNFVFRKGLRRILPCLNDEICLTWADLMKSDFSATGTDIVIVSCANWLGTSDKDEIDNLNRAVAIEKFDCPVLSFGLGIQAAEASSDIKLGPNSIRLAKTLSQGHHTLSVRDCHTQKVLASAGIGNTVVTGCPSNFINLNLCKQSFEQHLAKFNSVSLIQFQLISEVAGANPRSGMILRKTLEMLRAFPYGYVLQTPELIRFVSRDVASLSQFYISNSPYDRNDTESLIYARSVFFASVDEWLLYCRRFAYSSGMRIHGSMIPLQAGVPSLLVSHDVRTSGLAEAMQMPSLTCEEYLSLLEEHPQAMLDRFFAMLPAFLAKRKELGIAFMKQLDRSGLILSNNFTDFLSKEHL